MIQIAQIAPARSGQFLQLLGVSGDDLLQEADVPLQCLGDGRRVLVSPGRRNIVLSQKLNIGYELVFNDSGCLLLLLPDICHVRFYTVHSLCLQPPPQYAG